MRQFSRGRKPSGWKAQFRLVGKHIGSAYIKSIFMHMIYTWRMVTHHGSCWLIRTHRDSSWLMLTHYMSHITSETRNATVPCNLHPYPNCTPILTSPWPLSKSRLNLYFTPTLIAPQAKMHPNPNTYYFHKHFYVSNIQVTFPNVFSCLQYPIYVSNIQSMFPNANDVSKRQCFQCMFPIYIEPF